MADTEPREMFPFARLLVLMDYLPVSCSFYEIFQAHKKGQKNHRLENKHISTHILTLIVRNHSAHKVESPCVFSVWGRGGGGEWGCARAFFLGGIPISFPQRGQTLCCYFRAPRPPQTL